MDVLLKLGIVLLVGLVGAKVARIFKLPNVSGYLVAGLFLGPSFFKLISSQDVETLAVISEFALAIIAFSIGSEFVLEDMKKLGSSIVIITLAEVVGALVVVFSVTFFIFKQPLAFSLVLASMSAATAPAATLLVMRQYRADGPLTRTILPVVALDDVFGIMAFGIAMSIARLSVGSVDHSFLRMVSWSVLEIIGSIVLGFVLGLCLTVLAKRAHDNDELLGVTLAFLGVATGLSKAWGLSSLLTSIVVGTTLVNLMHNSSRVFLTINHFTPPIYVLFFTLAGASLDLGVLFKVGALGVTYIFARAAGKMIGAWIGAKAVKAPPAVTNYLGLALLPQGGVSIGLSVLVRQMLPEYSVAITTIIMFSVLVYEVAGPIFAKIALEKAGEIGGLDKRAESPSIQTYGERG
ncbi:MAG: cation:proton antiporter [Firmicutes bacterium]|nr:cation:proton antiporter [Bacillota bacterium]